MFADDDTHGTMLTMIFHTRVFAQILKCAAEISLADHLSAGSLSPKSVAAAADLDARLYWDRATVLSQWGFWVIKLLPLELGVPQTSGTSVTLAACANATCCEAAEAG
jgi:hypothetical protein